MVSFQIRSRSRFAFEMLLQYVHSSWAKLLRGVLRSRHLRLRWWSQQVFWRVEDSFVTLVARPVAGMSCPDHNTLHDVVDTAIVVQGKVDTNQEFSLTTLKSYRLAFPGAPIILSTWDDSDGRFLAEARALGCDVVLNQNANLLPGISNSNLQMVSTRAGILRAKSLGIENVLKTRTDQRIYNKLVLHGLNSMSDLFPLAGVPNANQKKRLIFSSANSFLYRPYSLSDMVMFGNVDDLLNYWTGRLDERVVAGPASTQRQWAMQRMAEVWFAGGFLENRGEQLDWTLYQYWEQLRLRFLVVDASFFDIYWPKYSALENRRSSYGGANLFEEVSHAHWLEIFKGRMVPDEDIADIKIT